MSDEQKLERLAKKIRVCTKCELHRARKTRCQERVPGMLEIMLIGEGPVREDEQGRPFVGASGKFLIGWNRRA